MIYSMNQKGANLSTGHNSIILMIEAQSRYLNTLVGEVIRARQQGETLALRPTLDALKEYNDRIQAVLRNSSFADPNCNSWYKTDDGNITNNWSGTVIDYQHELSLVRWEDYVADGTGKNLVAGKKVTKLGRVREESMLSDTSLLLGAVSLVAMVGGCFVARPKFLKAH